MGRAAHTSPARPKSPPVKPAAPIVRHDSASAPAEAGQRQPLPAHPTNRDWRRHQLLQLQRHVGNGAVGRLLRPPAPTAGRRVQRRAPDRREEEPCPACSAAAPCPRCAAKRTVQRQVIRRDETDDRATEIADEIYAALNWVNNEPRAIRAMTGHNAAMRSRIADAFREEHDQSLRGYLYDQLSGDWVVKAYALLKSSHTADYHTAMGLALIPFTTRDEEVFRILFGLSLSGRQQLESDYNDAFGTRGNGVQHLGEGSLKQDLIDDLSGWREEKSLALLNRDLNEADKLYFNTAGRVGTDDDAVIRQLQRIWDSGGAAGVNQLEREWNETVRNQNSWSEDTWTDETLYDTLDSELSFEAWELARAILRGAQSYNEQVGVEVGPLTEDQQFDAEDVELQVANDTLTAATTGDSWYEGAGTNEAQVFRAVSTIRRVWQARIERARGAGDEAQAAEYERQWHARRAEIVQFIPDEMSEGSADYAQTRLLLSGDLEPVDELYLASIDFDDAKVVQLVTQYWAQGKINDIRDAAGREKRDDSGNVIRPVFPLLFVTVRVGGDAWHRAQTLLYRDKNDAQRGADRLAWELEQGDDESDLRRGYQLLTTQGISADLRQGVIAAYVAAHCSNAAGDTPARKFISHIAARYENSTAVWDFRDLLDPASSAGELVERAEGRLEASRSGWFDAILEDAIRDYDELTGEDTLQVTQESLERLRLIAAQANATGDELSAMLAVSGAASPLALANLEYSAFRARLEEVRSLKRSIADAIAITVEIAVDLALTAVTGGGAAGLLVASLGAAVAGMVVREALQGQEHDFFSEENLRTLVLAAASAGLGEAARPLGEAAEEVGALMRAGDSTRAFLRGATTEGFTQVNTQILAAGLENKMPTGEQIAAQAFGILGRVAGAGRAQSYLQQHGETLRTRAIAGVSQELTGGLAEESAEIARTGNLSGPDVAARLARRVGTSVRDGLRGAARDEIDARGQAARQQRLLEGGDADAPTRTPEADDEAPRPPVDEAEAEAANLQPDEVAGRRSADDEAAQQAADDPDAARRHEEEMARIGPVNEETDAMLRDNPQLRRALADYPAVARILKLCNSPCLPPHATRMQIVRLNMMLGEMTRAGFDVNNEAYQRQLREYFHEPTNFGNLDRALEVLATQYRALVLEQVDTMVRTAEGVPMAGPDQAQFMAALQALRDGRASRGDMEILLRRVVADFRAYRGMQYGEPGGALVREGRHHAEAMSGACGPGRDVTTESLQSLTDEFPGVITVHRYQAGDLLPSQQHGFAVVTFPDGTRFLVDPTFAQFMDAQSGRPVAGSERPRGGRYTGGQALDEGGSLADAAFVSALVRDGFMPLTPATAGHYALALTPGRDPGDDPAFAAFQILTGRGAELIERTGGGEIVRTSDRDEATFDDYTELTAEGAGYTLSNEIDEMIAAHPNHPFVERLRDLSRRLRAYGVRRPDITFEGQEGASE